MGLTKIPKNDSPDEEPEEVDEATAADNFADSLNFDELEDDMFDEEEGKGDAKDSKSKAGLLCHACDLSCRCVHIVL